MVHYIYCCVVFVAVTSEQEARLQPQATLVGQSVETEIGASEPRVSQN